LLTGASVAGLDQVPSDVNAQLLRTESRCGQGGRIVAAAEVEDSQPLVMPIFATSASPLSRLLSAMRVKSPFSQRALFGFI
jgi:hypothetical protein